MDHVLYEGRLSLIPGGEIRPRIRKLMHRVCVCVCVSIMLAVKTFGLSVLDSALKLSPGRTDGQDVFHQTVQNVSAQMIRFHNLSSVGRNGKRFTIFNSNLSKSRVNNLITPS